MQVNDALHATAQGTLFWTMVNHSNRRKAVSSNSNWTRTIRHQTPVSLTVNESTTWFVARLRSKLAAGGPVSRGAGDLHDLSGQRFVIAAPMSTTQRARALHNPLDERTLGTRQAYWLTGRRHMKQATGFALLGHRASLKMLQTTNKSPLAAGSLPIESSLVRDHSTAKSVLSEVFIDWTACR